jgi:hypothetical protein
MAADVPHVLELASFERARLLLTEAHGSGEQTVAEGDLDPRRDLEAHPLAAVVRFRAPANRVIAAAMQGRSLPPVADCESWVLVAARLPNLARSCDAMEARWLQALADAPATPETLCEDPTAFRALTNLWQAGALRVVD